MFAPPADALEAGREALVVAAFFLVLGRLVADLLPAAVGLDGLARWGLSFAGFGVYTLVVMLAHIATGGAVLASAAITRGITAAAFAALGLRAVLVRRSRRSREPSRTSAWAALVAAGLVLVAVAVWGSPVFRLLPLDYRGDTTNLHAGWTSEIMNGEPVPTATVTGAIPNFYPWLFHGMSALIARFTPGGRALHALGPLQLLQVAGSVLGLFALGRALVGRLSAGASTALFGALAGGLGFVLLRSPDVVLDPRLDGMLYLGDLLYKRSYNVAFYGLSPPFPRDVGSTLLVGALIALVVGLRSTRASTLVAAGVVLGLVGLTGAESFIVGMGVALAATVWPPRRWSRVGVAASAPLVAAAVSALWWVPQAINYVRLGGYVNITEVGPVSLPLVGVLVGWGAGTPLAVLGAVRWVPRARDDVGARIVLALALGGGGAILGSAALPEVLGPAFMALGRPHRYWPLLHLGVALYAGIGAALALEWLRARRRIVAVTLALVVALLAIASPVAASIGLIEESRRGYVYREALRGAPRALLNLVAPAPSARCHAAVPAALDTAVWAYSGYRLVAYSRPTPQRGNQARIRWRDIYDHIVPEGRRMRDNVLLTEGRAGPSAWRATARRYGVDVVVAAVADARARGFRGLEAEISTDVPAAVFRLSNCGT